MRAYTNAKPEQSFGKSLLEEARSKLIVCPQRAASARPAFALKKEDAKNYQTLTVNQLRQMQAEIRRQKEAQELEKAQKQALLQKRLEQFA